MNRYDKARLKTQIFEVIGAVIDVEELRFKSTNDEDEKVLTNFVMDAHTLIGNLAEHFKIEL